MSLFGGLKDKLSRAYARHSQLFDAAGKFLLCGGMCILIREAVPFHALLSNLLLLGVISAIAMLLPLQVIPVIGAVLITAQSFALDIAAGGAAAALRRREINDIISDTYENRSQSRNPRDREQGRKARPRGA